MAASYKDEVFLAADPDFQNRVRQSLILFIANSIGTEDMRTTALHGDRQAYASVIMGNPDNYKLIFSQMVATNATVISDATQAGTVVLTSGNAATQAALVTDVHIDNAIASKYNIFLASN